MRSSKHIAMLMAVLLLVVLGDHRSRASAIGDKTSRALQKGDKQGRAVEIGDKMSESLVAGESESPVSEAEYHCSVASLPSIPTADNAMTFHINDTVFIANTPYKCTINGWLESKEAHPRRQKRFIFSLLIGLAAKFAVKAAIGKTAAAVVGAASNIHTGYEVIKTITGGRSSGGSGRDSNKAPYFTYCPSIDNPIYTLNNTAIVTWDHPNGTDPEDGYLSPLLISGAESGSEFSTGQHDISYRIQDSRGSKAYCRFSFEVNGCGDIPRGQANEVQCSFTEDDHLSCKVACKAGYTFVDSQLPDNEYICGRNTSYEWSDKLPSCAVIKPPKSLISKTRLSFANMPCDRKREIEAQLRHEAHEHYPCVQNKSCIMDVRIEDCRNETQKSDNLDISIDFNFPLDDLRDLGLEHLNADSLTVSEDLRKLIEALSELESTAENLHNMSISLDGVEHVLESSESDADVICRKGEGSVNAVCAECPVGTYSDQNQCKLCDFGTYQDQTGQTSCKLCSHPDTTDAIGAKDPNDCRRRTQLYVPGRMWVRRGKPISVPVVSKQFIFEAKGCDDVWVFLSKTRDDMDNMYYIGLGRGSDTYGTINKNSLQNWNITTKAGYKAPMLNCNKFVKFWITWENYHIKVGLGNRPDSMILMEWQDPGPVIDVNYVSLSSFEDPWTIIY